ARREWPFNRCLRVLSSLYRCEIPRGALRQFNMKLIRRRRCAIDVSSSPVIGEGFTILPVFDKFLDQFANAARNIFQRDRLFMQTDQSFAGDCTTHVKRIFPWSASDE